ncbi:MAG: Gfo/Idh/MocA family oxidoreductase [Clostridia bacterium]|nr:Gfo/Idh/MocA family oxidoreductase [Clostridia bacterium]
MEKVRYGVVGVGNQGSTYVLKYFDGDMITDGCLTAVCDINPDKIKNIRDNLKNISPEYFDNYIEMLDSGLCDAVLIETPHYDHPTIAIECFKRGIHVISEKPAGVYAKQVKEMNRAAEESGVKFAVMFNQRTNGNYRKMREMIANGAIGDLQRVTWIITNWFRTQAYYDAGSWRATWDGEGGGVLINQCPHQLDLVSWIVGKQPKYVNGFCQYGKWHDIEVEDDVTAYFEYDNGATGMFITSTGETPGTNRLEISGTLGKLVCEKKHLYYYKNNSDSQEFSRTTTEGFSTPGGSESEIEPDSKGGQHRWIINNFTAAILGKDELFVDGKEGINGVELMNAIEYSGWKGGIKVELPVDEDLYLEELNRHRAQSKKKLSKETVTNTEGTY